MTKQKETLMFHTNNPIIKHKVGLLNLAEELGNVSKACQVMGVSRDTFYRYQELVDEGGLEALISKSRRTPNLKNRVDPDTEKKVCEYAIEFPTHGQARTSNELRKRGIFVSGSGVRSVWLRNNLENFKKRLKALEDKVAQEGILLSDEQVAALEKKKQDDEACGEIETAHPGYPGSQDTFYVGTLKGVGRIYQQTFVDTYSKIAFARLYTTKTPVTAADMLNDKVLPFFAEQEIPLLRILTDRGTEYCGRMEHHDYQLYLAINDIDHTKTKARSPQTNGICERFHKTILQEFYQVTFRKKLYSYMEELQKDLDEWIRYYNNERTHQGKICCGRTPMDTLTDGKSVWAEKNQALDISEERYELAMSVANDGLFDWNMETDEVLFDNRYYTMAQYNPGDFPQSYEQWVQRIHVEDRAQVISRVQNYIDGKINKYDIEFRFLRKDGSYVWIRARGGIVSHDKTGKPLRFLGTHSDITDRKKIEKQITTHAYYDSLTSLPNRFLSLERLDLLIKKAERKQYKIAVLFLDLDDFKKVNDSLGHEVGDRVLIEAASRLKSIIRNEDTVGRLGGDEFILLLDGLKKSTDAEPVAKKLIQKYQLPFTIDKRELILTTSVGIAIYPEDGSTAARLLRHADAAMYNAKALGRNTFSFFTEELNHKVVRRLALEEQLHGALKRKEFIVYFQPKIDIANGHIMGAEALLRWSNPVLGQVSPDEFIPLVEQSGLIISLGEFVLKQPLTILKQWQHLEQVKNEQFSIAINLSPRQFRDPRLADTFIQLIKQYGLSFHLIELEITEGILMSGHHYINDSLLQLSQSGLLLAMNDFGTGYSSLSYLRKYPFNIVKIDRSFINEMDSNHNDRELINSIISMAHSLNLKVVAEAVETESQLNYLRQIGCDYAQGYYFSKPLSASKMEKFLLS